MQDTDQKTPAPRLGPLVFTDGSLRAYLADKFRYYHGYIPNLSAPSTFNEKIFHRMLFDRRPILMTFADKIAVRQYVGQKLKTIQHLSTIYRIFDKSDDLYGFEFPPRFVLKANHGSGWNYIHAHPTHVNVVRLARLARQWLKGNFAFAEGEWAYKDVQPKLICEEYLGTDQSCPVDYKFFCFAGKAQFIQVDFDRHDDHKRNIYDSSWNLLDIQYHGQYHSYPQEVGTVARPGNLSEMKSVAELLSDGMDFVRVDLYDLGDRIVFGELTNYPAAGCGRFCPAKWDSTFGSYWHLPQDLTATVV
jgi:TupA-like ATPgrasp